MCRDQISGKIFWVKPLWLNGLRRFHQKSRSKTYLQIWYRRILQRYRRILRRYLEDRSSYGNVSGCVTLCPVALHIWKLDKRPRIVYSGPGILPLFDPISCAFMGVVKQLRALFFKNLRNFQFFWKCGKNGCLTPFFLFSNYRKKTILWKPLRYFI